MKRHGFLITAILVFLGFNSWGFDMTRVNLNYQYDVDGIIKSNYRVVQEGGNISVFLEVKSDTLINWNLHLLLQDKYNSEAHDTLRSVRVDTLRFKRGDELYRLNIGKPSRDLLLICMYDHGKGILRIQDVRVQSPVGFVSDYPVDAAGIPIINSYLTDDSVQFGTSDQLHVFRYIDNFPPSDPPMGLMRPIAPSLEVDSSYHFNGELKNLENFKFYLIQSDSMAENALTLLKCPPYYPEFGKLDELVGPLTYITTPTELKALRSSLSKKSFENFWIRTYGTKFRAKSAIRYFYNQVENANMLFTDYKQGWKTDRGMIYIVYGKPDRVWRNERSEIWEYYDGVQFEFIRISTLFTPTMYSLKRDRSYEKDWYNKVGNLRKGL